MTRYCALLALLLMLSCMRPGPPAVATPPPSPPVAPSAADPAPVARSRMVAPLLYDETLDAVRLADESFRTSPPAVSLDAPRLRIAVQSFSLENGLRVLFVERHAFPIVSAQLVIRTGAVLGDDVGGHRAYLLGRTFLSPLERVLQTSGQCSVDSCIVASRATSLHLSEVLGRVADLVVSTGADRAVYEKRLAAAERVFEQSETSLLRIQRALLFGAGHRYGGPPQSSPAPLADLERLRTQAFVPAAATLVVVGDASRRSVESAAAVRFGPWRASQTAAPQVAPPPPPPDGPRLVVSPNRTIGQVWGAIIARGPSPRDRDLPAFEVLAQLLGGNEGSELFHRVREDMGAAYTIHAAIDRYGDATVMRVVGSFDQDPIAGTKALSDAISAARDSECSTETLARAKGAVVGVWRRTMATDVGIATLIADSVVQRVSVEALQERPALVAAVTAADVRAVARRYLSNQALRAILIGKPEHVTAARTLGFGEPTTTDGFGRAMLQR
jgi:zinc protease